MLTVVSILVLTTACSDVGESGTVDAPAPVAASPTLRIMPLGDSITEGADGSATYRYWLWRHLRQAGIDVDFVGSMRGVYGGTPRFADFDQDHEGHWAWTTGRVRDRIDEWARRRPDVVLIHLGTNDAGRPLSPILDNLSAIVAALRRANPQVVIMLARLIPVFGYEEAIATINAALPDLVERLHTERSPVVLVDQWTGFDAAVDTYDGIHPNESGERKMAQRWFDALRTWQRSRQGDDP